MIITYNFTWTLEEAIEFIRMYQKFFKNYNYHIGLCGSVLNDGKSDKDLDIVVMGLHNKQYDNEIGLLEFLRTSFEAQNPNEFKIKEENPYDDSRLLMIGNWNNKRIDFFIYSGDNKK